MAAPDLLAAGRNGEEAAGIVARAVGLGEGQRVVTIPTHDGDLAIIQRDRLAHLVEKRDDARERYARYILPTLQDPYEIWLTDYDDGLRKQYVGLFTGPRDLLAVIRLERDGGLIWNIMQADDRRMNAHRVGSLVYGK